MLLHCTTFIEAASAVQRIFCADGIVGQAVDAFDEFLQLRAYRIQH